MACAPHTCNYHNTGYTTCAGHRPPNSPTGGVLLVPNVGDRVDAAYINNVRAQIRNEIRRWEQHSFYNPSVNADPAMVTGVPQGTEAMGSLFQTFETKMNEVFNRGDDPHGHPHKFGGAFVGPSGPTIDVPNGNENPAFPVGSVIFLENLRALIRQYNEFRMDCICNSDCACNSNCACHGDCGCNYSDKRLKREISYC